ncbi:MAG TPA: electron transfer flavoprotein subunit alpha/FixB family protein [Candidatus Binataceae bacterium]|nr:electron transfer flavoprotein subunit alpha/FixB family protein [Candidatus Binataceae bacterium]
MTAAANGVLVIADGGRHPLGATTREMLALGRQLTAGLGGAVGLLVFGRAPAEVAGAARDAGADRVYRVPGCEAIGYHPETFAALAVALCRTVTPRAVILPQGPLGSDLAPRLAFMLQAPWAVGCEGAAIEDSKFVCTRSQIGGKIRIQEAYSGDLVVLTLRPKCVDPLPLADGAPAEIVELPLAPALDGQRLVFEERISRPVGVVEELEQAEVIVSGGRGIGSPEGFTQLEELAQALGGRLGASKMAVDRQWVAQERQIGMTGTTVAPRLYVAVAISGATQHLLGCRKSKVIVAVNKDPAAPIFQYAHYGIVGKWEEVVPELIRQVRAS